MRTVSLRTLGRALAALAGVAFLAGANCGGDDPAPAPGPAGEHLLVRTASGPRMDVTGTSWVACIQDETNYRLTTMSFGPGTFTIGDRTYTTSDCTGTPISTAPAVTAPIVATGDHDAGWNGTPPPGLATTVTATAVIATWPAGSGLPAEMKTLLFVNDGPTPDELHMGKGTPGPDGYPLTLEVTRRVER